MILKGSQRGGPRQLAAHLLNEIENDHVTVEDLRGFVAGDLHGAMAETHSIAKGTQCRQCVFSLSLNPPRDAEVSLDDLIEAADRAEEALGLTGQPRALVIHEKQGRRHAHVVWSRIDADQMKAINMPHYKNRLNALSRELYLEHGWELPEGHRTNGWKNPLNFTLAEWQQAKRLDLDPRELKQLFQDAWRQSDSLPAFRAALEERGYYLAKGDRRGFVALDHQGEVFSVSRMTGVKSKELQARLGDPEKLPGVEEVQGRIRARTRDQLKSFIREDQEAKREELRPLRDERRRLIKYQRAERVRLLDVQRLRHGRETVERSSRFKSGFFGKAADFLSGRYFSVRLQNERETLECTIRDRAQREAQVKEQAEERRDLQTRMSAMLTRHRAERMELSDQIASAWKAMEQTPNRRTRERRFDDPGLDP